MNKRKDSLTIGKNHEENKEDSFDEDHKLPLSQIPNSELINYFWVSTEIEKPLINIMAWRPSVYPRAEKWAKDAAWALDRNYFMGEYRVKYWIIDFIEWADGLTYLSQVKSFCWEKVQNI